MSERIELPYGFGFCNPAHVGEPAVSNEEYIATLEGDPWHPVFVAAAAVLDLLDPNWKVVQIKEKFGECRFYIDGNKIAQDFSRIIERACDELGES